MKKKKNLPIDVQLCSYITYLPIFAWFKLAVTFKQTLHSA